MKRATGLIALLMILIAAPAFAVTYRAELGEERSGDADGSGLAIITIEGNTVSYVLTYQNIATPTAAHIHTGAIDVDGPVLVDLMGDFGTSSASGSVTASQEDIDAITANPSGHYVNIHTNEFPGGAIRGQLEPAGASRESLLLNLTGDAEVPGPGDSDGSGLATIEFHEDSLTYTIQVENVANPTAAHIHSGSALQPGPIVVDLDVMFQNGIATGTVPLDSATRQMILTNLEEFYLNVHSAEFPAGAVRAQLATEWVLPVVGKTRGAVGTNFVTDVRVANLSMHPAELRFDFFPSTLTGLDEPSVSRTFVLPPMSLGIADDIVGDFLGTEGLGALTISSTQEIAVTARVINDLRDQDMGTNGLFLTGRRVGDAPTSGVFPFLSSTSPEDRQAGIGFRTNVGFFNPTDEPVELTMTLFGTEGGRVMGTKTVTVQPFQHLQQSVFELVDTVPEADRAHTNFWGRWSADGPIFVYAAVTDNRTGDAMVLE